MPSEPILESALDLVQLKRFVREKILPSVREWDEKEVCPESVFQDLHRLGVFHAFSPQECGGLGSSVKDLALIARALAYGSPGVFSSAIASLLAISPIALYGSPALKRLIAENYVNRFTFWSYCMTEPDSGSEISKLRTIAKKTKGGYLIQGRKCFITNANLAKHLVVFASMEGSWEGGKSNLSAFYIPADTSGVSTGKPLRKLGQRDSNTSEVFFDNVFVPEEHRIGNEGQGLQIAFRCLQRSKTLIAAAAVGSCDRIFDLVSHHLEQRVLYGKPLIEIPSIHSLLAKLYTHTEAAWLLTQSAARCWDSGDFAIKEASMAKMFSSDHTVRFANEALELFGGYGYTREYEIEKIYRDVKVYEIYEGPTLVQQALIAREIFPSLKGATRQGNIKKGIKAAA